MSNKVDLDQIEMTARSVGIDPTQIKTLVSDLERVLQEEKDLKDVKPREKKQFVIVANTDGLDEEIAGALSEIPMTVLQYPEEGDHNDIIPSIHKACYEFNVEIANKKKGKKQPVAKIFEAFGAVAAKFFKPHKVQVKSKEPVIVLTTDNLLPIQNDKV